MLLIEKGYVDSETFFTQATFAMIYLFIDIRHTYHNTCERYSNRSNVMDADGTRQVC